MRKSVWTLSAFLMLGAVGACGGDKTQVAPDISGSALASSKPKSANAKTFLVETSGSNVGFMMEAPDEKIRGKAPDSTSGYAYIDPADLSQTTGNVIVDIDKLELFQRKKDGGEFGQEVREPTQNEHARNWLEINADAEKRELNRRVEFKIEKVKDLSEKDLSKLSGAERTVTFKAEGLFLLHGKSATKTVDMKAVFTFEGDKATSVHLKTVSPFAVNLAEFEVKPRDAFGKFTKATLDSLAPKVAKEALIEFDLKLNLAADDAKPAPLPPMQNRPPASAEPAPSASAAASTSASAGPAPSTSAAPSAGAPPPPKPVKAPN